MIYLDGTLIENKRFPDNTIALKLESYNGDPRLTWLYDNDEEIFMVYTITKHLQNLGFRVRLYMPYIPNARMDSKISENTIINMPARIRMTTLFAVSQSMNGRVANTCNLSEDWVGYATLFGDGAGQFSPLSKLTVKEVKYLGYLLGLPEKFIEKVPTDGLCGQTDEDKLGFTYDTLDTYIRTGYCEYPKIQEKIDKLHVQNKFKLELMPVFYTCIPSIIW